MAMAWAYRRHISKASFSVMFLAFTGIVAFLLHDYTVVTSPERMTSISTTQFYSFVFMVIVLCLVGSQLLESLARSEQLADSLELQVQEKTATHEKTFEQLTQSRRQAVSDER